MKIRAVLCLLLLATVAPTFAQHAKRTPVKPVTVSVRTTKVTHGKPVTVAIRLTIRPGWHIFWKTAGDGGKPTSIRLTAPSGWKTGDLRFPVPVKAVDSGRVEYQYTREATVLCDLTPTDSAKMPLNLTVAAEWLACGKDTIPGKTTIHTRAGKVLVTTRDLNSAKKELPALYPGNYALHQLIPEIPMQAGPVMMIFPIDGRDAGNVTDIYVESMPGYPINYGKAVVLNAVAMIPVIRPNATGLPAGLRGILIVGDRQHALEFNAEHVVPQ